MLTAALCQIAYPDEVIKPIVVNRASSAEAFKLPISNDKVKGQKKGILWLDSMLSLFSSSSSTDRNHTFALDSMTIFLNGKSPDLMPIALKMIKNLEIINPLVKITIIPDGATIAKGGRQSDYFITLRHEGGDSEKIHLAGGTSLLGEFGNYNKYLFSLDDFAFSARIKFSHHSVSINSTQKTHAINTDKAANKLSEHVIDYLKDRVKNVPFRALFPESFYPEYREAPEFDFLKENNSQMLMSASGLLSYNTSNWIFDSDKSPQELLPKLLLKLEKKGWQKERLLLQDEGIQFLRMSNKEKGLYLNIALCSDKLSKWLEPQTVPGHRYNVVYQDYCPRKEVLPVIEKLLKNSPSADQTLLCINYLRDEYRERTELVDPVLSKIDTQMSPDQLLRICEYYCSNRKHEQGRDYYIQAALNHMWRGKKGMFNGDYVKQFKFVKELATANELPFSLTPDEKKRYKIRNFEDIVGKEFELKMGEACPVFTSLTDIKGYCVYSKKTLTNSRAYFLSEVDVEKTGSFSWYSREMTIEKPSTNKFVVNDLNYTATIRINKSGDSYNIKFTQE